MIFLLDWSVPPEPWQYTSCRALVRQRKAEFYLPGPLLLLVLYPVKVKCCILIQSEVYSSPVEPSFLRSLLFSITSTAKMGVSQSTCVPTESYIGRPARGPHIGLLDYTERSVDVELYQKHILYRIELTKIRCFKNCKERDSPDCSANFFPTVPSKSVADGPQVPNILKPTGENR